MRTLKLGAAALLLLVPISGCRDSASSPVSPEKAPMSQAAATSLSPAALQNIDERQNFEVVPLAGRSGFPDAVDMTFRIKLDGKSTNVAHVRDPSDVVFVQATFGEGGSAGWHTHPGPGIIAVRTGRLGIINASDCVLRIYEAGQALIDPGQGNIHVGFNALSEGEGETVLVVAFLDVPPGEPVSTPAPNPGC
jgi:hypothetical protein